MRGLEFINVDILDIPKLTKTISKFFYERCGVGHLDISYPSNKALFGSLLNTEVPRIIIKKSNALMEKRDNIRRRTTMTINSNVTHWGHIFAKDDLTQNLGEIFDYVVEVYWGVIASQKEKIMAIYNMIYTSPKKDLMKGKIAAYHSNISGYNYYIAYRENIEYVIITIILTHIGIRFIS